MAGFAQSKGGRFILVALAGTVIGVAVALGFAIPAMAVALVIAFLATTSPLVHPERAFIVLVLLLALVPVYASPQIGHILLMPAAGAAWILAGVLMWRCLVLDGYWFRATAVDVAVGVFALFMAVSATLSPQENVSSYLELVFSWGGIYVAARLLLRETHRPTFLVATSFALVTALLAPVAILETAGRSNPFFAFQFDPVQSAAWAKEAGRLGQMRAEASFGHPIALSMFAATSALLSLAMAINTAQPRSRLVWFGLAILAVGVQTLTLSRTGWVMLTLGVVVLSLTTASGAARRRLIATILVALTVVTATLFVSTSSSQLQLLSGSGIGAGADMTAGSAEVANSGAGRTALLNRALQPGVLQAWGSPVNRITPAVSNPTDSTDNEYVLLAEEWGLIPLAAFVLVGLTLMPLILRSRFRESEPVVALPIAAFASLVGLFFVAFITQQQLMIWLLLGASGAIAERVRSVSRVRRPPHGPRRPRTALSSSES